MMFKVLSTVVIFMIQDATTQSVSCSYSIHSAFGYTCTMALYNPTGFDDFTQISGTHLSGKTNDNVVGILSPSGSSNSKNFPSIICQQFKNIVNIDFRSNGIEIIGDNSFKNCKNLYLVYLNFNKISEISENAFVNNVNLAQLNLYKNKIRNLSKNVFVRQQKLTELYLYDNEIENLPFGIFHWVSKLRYLELDNNNITEISDNLTARTNLESLSLGNNLISELSENTFVMNLKLKFLNLDENQIKCLPKNVFKSQTKLEILWLSRNLIEDLDGNVFFTTINLKILYLNNNKLKTLPAAIFSTLRNLNLLDISSNQLTTLHSDSFGDHDSLTDFYFRINDLNAFDEKIIDKINLSVLRGRYNPCIPTTSFLSDYSKEKTQMRAALKICFDNYVEREKIPTTTTTTTTVSTNSNQCFIENLQHHVCYLDGESKEGRENIENIKEQIRSLTNEINTMNKKIIEFARRPCSCKL